MAYVWKHPNSPYWTAVFKNELDQWEKRTTKKTERTAALVMALEFERAASMARNGILTEAVSREIIGGILERSCGETLRKTSLREWADIWIKGKTKARQEGTATRYKGSVDAFLTFMGPKADRPITAVARVHFQNYFDYLQGERGLAPASCVVEIKTLRSLFNAALRVGLVQENPALAVELPDRIKQVRRGVFTEAQVQMLLDAAGEVANGREWKTAILFGYFAGLRLGDATALEWSAVDFMDRKLRVTTQKTNDALEIPMHATLQAHLEELAGDATGSICPHLSAVPVSGRSGLSKQFIRIMKSAGIDNNAAQTGGVRSLSKLSFHALRASFNSALANRGVDQEIRRKLTGHKSDAVNDRYTRTELSTLRAAIEKLPSTIKA